MASNEHRCGTCLDPGGIPMSVITESGEHVAYLCQRCNDEMSKRFAAGMEEMRTGVHTGAGALWDMADNRRPLWLTHEQWVDIQARGGPDRI